MSEAAAADDVIRDHQAAEDKLTARLRVVASLIAGLALVVAGIWRGDYVLMAMGGTALGIPGVTELLRKK